MRSGGVLILDAACPQGIGDNVFFQLLQQAPDYRKRVPARSCRRAATAGDHKAVRLRHLTDPACRNVRLFIVSPCRLTADDARILGATKAASSGEALRLAGVAGSSALICDVVDAGHTCLEIRGS